MFSMVQRCSNETQSHQSAVAPGGGSSERSNVGVVVRLAVGS